MLVDDAAEVYFSLPSLLPLLPALAIIAWLVGGFCYGSGFFSILFSFVSQLTSSQEVCTLLLNDRERRINLNFEQLIRHFFYF